MGNLPHRGQVVDTCYTCCGQGSAVVGWPCPYCKKPILAEEKARVLWFSRHPLSAEQLADLERVYGPVDIHQVNRTIQAAREIVDDIAQCDVIAIVAPLPLQKEFLELAGDKPVLFCKNSRLVDPEDGMKVTFAHAGWFQIRRIEVIFDRL